MEPNDSVIIFFAIVIFGTAAAACVLFILFLSIFSDFKTGRYISATLAIRQTLESLFTILVPKSNDTQVVGTETPPYEISTPYRKWWFWLNEKPKIATLVNVKVPIGYVVQLPFDRIDSSERYLESSQICFTDNLNASNDKRFVNMNIMPRAESWSFTETVPNTKENCQISASFFCQTELLPIGCTQEEMSQVFSGYEIYVRQVRNSANTVLQKLAFNGYDWLMTHNSEILKELNEIWSNPEISIAPICRSYFSAVVISPLLGYEYTRIGATLTKDLDAVRQQIIEKRATIEGIPAEIRQEFVNACRSLRVAFGRFGLSLDVGWIEDKQDSPDYRNDVKSIVKQLDDGFEGFANRLENQLKRNDSHVVDVGELFSLYYSNLVKDTIMEIEQSLKTLSFGYQKLCDKMKEYERNIRTEN